MPSEETVKAVAVNFDKSETEVIHPALTGLAKEEMPGDEADGGPLSEADLSAVDHLVKARMPNSIILRKRSLFEDPDNVAASRRKLEEDPLLCLFTWQARKIGCN